MNQSVSLKLSYQEGEVVSAQRMRLLRSSRLKTVSTLGIIGTVALIIAQIHARNTRGSIPSTWFTPVYLPLVFVAVAVIVYFLAPAIDFRLNPAWKAVLDLHLSEEKLRLTMQGKMESLEWGWEQVSQVLEKNKVYIIFWGSEQDWLIVPKRVLGEYEDWFRGKVNRCWAQGGGHIHHP